MEILAVADGTSSDISTSAADVGSNVFGKGSIYFPALFRGALLKRGAQRKVCGEREHSLRSVDATSLQTERALDDSSSSLCCVTYFWN